MAGARERARLHQAGGQHTRREWERETMGSRRELEWEHETAGRSRVLVSYVCERKLLLRSLSHYRNDNKVAHGNARQCGDETPPTPIARAMATQL